MPRLYKKEKLCSVVAIEQLFAPGTRLLGRAIDYPLRALWRRNPRRRSDAPVQFLVMVPKRRLRKAVDRVLMRRRIREAYRLLRDSAGIGADERLDVAFVYVANGLSDYAHVEHAMQRLLRRIKKSTQREPLAHDADNATAHPTEQPTEHPADDATQPE